MTLAVVTGPLGQSVADAGKRKRKDGSLERLRERNASERWNVLQKIWRPFRDDDEAGGNEGTVVEAAKSGSAESSTDNPGQAERPFGLGTLSEGAGALLAAPASGIPTVVTSAPISSGDDVRLEPVWSLDDAAPAQDARELVPPGDAAANPECGAVAKPKPITSILPYYDYSPDGKDDCERLCPRPAGCPESDKYPCPELCDLNGFQWSDAAYEPRAFAETHVTWEPSNLFANPLYFEDASLERYGHTHHELLQPFVSLGKFGVQLVGLPYQMALHPIHEHRYALGWYRPGECAPYKYYLPPWNTKAAVTAGAAYTGLFYLIP